MRKLFLLLLIPALLTGLAGCMTAYVPRPPQLVDVPLRPHRHDVKIYLEGEKPENPDYYKVVALDVPIAYGSFHDKLHAFKTQGQRLGLDAVLLLGATQAYQPGEFGPIPYGAVHAIGIKYRDSLYYVSEYIRRKDVFVHGSDGDTSLAYQAHFNPMGEELAHPYYRSDTLYRRYVQRYALDYLLNATDRWAFLADTRGNIEQRTHYFRGMPELTCLFKYNDYENVSEIKITSQPRAYPASPWITERMVLKYDGQLLVAEKLIYGAKKQLKYREVVSYYPSGRIRQTVLYAQRKGWEQPLVTTVYHYHSLDDLPAITKGL
ncbi:MAG: hypothetical protein AVDCRST_MAG56-5824 [uncultured Cytophagales bacterium]|uniref:Uncharacterized protein n=1 Tax=uncultured Cytophagales bacterium TaxID=158755 RepID=A0A6J4K2Z0_9SPHI|nr:MAG: hypothetical protein AVDCRST_MAG56-5824 [uncultured Cytophagales bacterium]